MTQATPEAPHHVTSEDLARLAEGIAVAARGTEFEAEQQRIAKMMKYVSFTGFNMLTSEPGLGHIDEATGQIVWRADTGASGPEPSLAAE